MYLLQGASLVRRRGGPLPCEVAIIETVGVEHHDNLGGRKPLHKLRNSCDILRDVGLEGCLHPLRPFLLGLLGRVVVLDGPLYEHNLRGWVSIGRKVKPLHFANRVLMAVVSKAHVVEELRAKWNVCLVPRQRHDEQGWVEPEVDLPLVRRLGSRPQQELSAKWVRGGSALIHGYMHLAGGLHSRATEVAVENEVRVLDALCPQKTRDLRSRSRDTHADPAACAQHELRSEVMAVGTPLGGSQRAPGGAFGKSYVRILARVWGGWHERWIYALLRNLVFYVLGTSFPEVLGDLVLRSLRQTSDRLHRSAYNWAPVNDGERAGSMRDSRSPLRCTLAIARSSEKRKRVSD